MKGYIETYAWEWFSLALSCGRWFSCVAYIYKWLFFLFEFSWFAPWEQLWGFSRPLYIVYVWVTVSIYFKSVSALKMATVTNALIFLYYFQKLHCHTTIIFLISLINHCVSPSRLDISKTVKMFLEINFLYLH